jgi:hypothetical protein
MLLLFESVCVLLFVPSNFCLADLNSGLMAFSSLNPVFESGFHVVKPVIPPLLSKFPDE